MVGEFEKVLEQVGFRVIHVIGNKNQEECFVAGPVDGDERHKFGVAVFSVRAMQALDEVLAKVKEGRR